MSKEFNAIIYALLILSVVGTKLKSQTINFNSGKQADLYKLNSIDSAATSLEIYRESVQLTNLSTNLNSKHLTNFKLDSAISYKPNQNNFPEKKYKSEYIYEDNREIRLSWNYNSTDKIWIPSSYIIIHFSNDGLVTRQSYNSWNGHYNGWTEIDAVLIRNYEYDNKDLLVSCQNQYMESIENNIIDNKYLFTYNADRLITKILHYKWDSGTDTLKLQDEYKIKYNLDNRIETIVYSKWNGGNSWEIQDSTRILYSQDNQINKELVYNWDSEIGYLPELEVTYKYNNSGKVEEKVKQDIYFLSENEWLVEETTYFSYYPFGSVQRINTYNTKNPNVSQRIYFSEFKYDELVNIESVVHNYTLPDVSPSYGIPDMRNHMIIEEKHYFDDFVSGVQLDFWNNYFYSEYSTSIKENSLLNKNEISVFPNPCFNFVTIEFDLKKSSKVDLAIYSMDQSKLIDISSDYLNAGQHKLQTDISSLSSGNYLCILKINNRMMNSEIISKM